MGAGPRGDLFTNTLTAEGDVEISQWDSGNRTLRPIRGAAQPERLLGSAQAYGRVARTGVEAHPLAGVAGALGVAALGTTLAMQRRRMPASSTASTCASRRRG